MSIITPDKWCIIKLPDNNGYKVLGAWYGGYLSPNEWRLSSGITKATLDESLIDQEHNIYLFENISGTTYQCHVAYYGLNRDTNVIANRLVKKGCKIMDEHTNWEELEL